jgi:hypothetical protein
MNPNVVSGRRKLQPIESIRGVLEGWQLTFDLCGVPGFLLGSTNFKENSKSFRTEVQIDEQKLRNIESDCPSEPDPSSPLLSTVKQRKSHPDLDSETQQKYNE